MARIGISFHRKLIISLNFISFPKEICDYRLYLAEKIYG